MPKLKCLANACWWLNRSMFQIKRLGDYTMEMTNESDEEIKKHKKWSSYRRKSTAIMKNHMLTFNDCLWHAVNAGLTRWQQRFVLIMQIDLKRLIYKIIGHSVFGSFCLSLSISGSSFISALIVLGVYFIVIFPLSQIRIEKKRYSKSLKKKPKKKMFD